jgi:hypothetical protein
VKFRLPPSLVLGVLLLPLVSRPAFCASITSSTHPALATYDFEAGPVPFAPFQKEGGVAPGTRFDLANGALTLTNAYAGSFGVDTKIAPFDADKYSHVSFDYALNPDVKVNIFFRLHDNGLYHGAIFSGPDTVRAGSVLLGEIPGVVADGKWHHADIPLRDWLRKLYPTKTPLTVDEIVIGNWDNSNYLMALGVAGNGAGATWKMDNFAITGAGPGEAKFQIKADDGSALAAPQEYSYALDDGPATPLTSAELTLSPGTGLHRLRLLDKNKKPAGSYEFFVAKDAPRVGKPELVNNDLRVPIESDAGLDAMKLKLDVGGHGFQLDSPYLTWDGAAGNLDLQAAAAGLQWPDGAQIPLALEGVQDVLGRAAPPLKTSLKMEYSRHKAPPPLPTLAVAQAVGTGTFEDSLDEWAPKTDWPGAAVVERDSETAASGKASVRLTAPVNAGNFGAYIRQTAFDAAKFPVIEFDYCIPPELRADFIFDWGGQTMSVGFTDRTPQWTRIGAVPEIVADGQWHHAQLRLYEMMRAAKPDASDFKVNWLALADAGWLGNPKGLCYWIDNFQFVPVAPGAPFRSKVLAADVTGVKGVSWTLDGTPKTEAPTAAKATDAIEATADGAQWLHVRAQNGAGEWSATSHVPLLLDVKPPQIGAALPASGAKAAAATLEIPVSDDTGVDLSSLDLTVQGRAYSLRDAELSYQQDRLIFSLDRAVRDGRLTPLANGATVAWKLDTVRDVAGQTVPGVSGAWTHDFALDKSGPQVRLTSPTHAALHFGAGDDASNLDPDLWDGQNLKLETAARDANDPRPTLRATPTADNTTFVLRLRRGWDIAKYPLLGFSYKMPAGQNLFLRLRGGRRIYALKFLGDAQGETIGEIAGGVADGQWHWAQIDLGALKDKIGNTVNMLEFVDASGKARTNAPLELGDFIVQQATKGNVKLVWRASDLSGVQNYRFAWDQTPTTAPTETTTDTTREITSKSGVWWAHLQAQDKAGNWSTVVHAPVIVP